MSTNVNRGIENRLDLDRSYAELNFRGIRTIFYRNGDEYDSGTMVVLSRKQFKHWITFLDYLTKKLGFEDFEGGGKYVAVSQGQFIHMEYGIYTSEQDDKKWKFATKIVEPHISNLDSAESVDIYLKRCGYKSCTGLPFPFDGMHHVLAPDDFQHYSASVSPMSPVPSAAASNASISNLLNDFIHKLR
ncbi:unnamed protein product [Dracunculus medinensis]|uniref:Doublecortin domain-containing protein n=1 Tax=Dracunculus medinensis TaxID=318479 RepID=A0A0N4UFR4_DRAME|nr:unnamed protein product [Dracunculus medinensis]